jgi:GT2 family glycosyltransferase
VKKSISIVIPTYKGEELLKKNLPSVITAAKRSEVDFEIIIVDDASNDNTIGFLTQNYPFVKVLQNDNNQGFSPTINKGIKAATKDLVLLLNNDVKLSEDYFLPQFKYFEKDDTFGVMGKIIGYYDDKIQDGGKYPQYSKLNISGTKNYIVLEETESWLPSFMLSGANALVNREKLFELGGFNEILAPFYWEDFELSVRAWRVGWNLYFEPAAICRHENSVTVKSFFKRKKSKTVSDRNKILTHWMHLDRNIMPLYDLKLFFKVISSALLGRWGFISAYKKAQERRKNAFHSRKQFEEFAKNQHSLLSMEQVNQKILAKINGKKIEIF